MSINKYVAFLSLFAVLNPQDYLRKYLRDFIDNEVAQIFTQIVLRI